MRKIAMSVLLALTVATTAESAQQTLNNTETMGVIRGKINDNFTDLYTNKADATHDHSGTYLESEVDGSITNEIQNSGQVDTDTTNFNNNLSATDTTVQAALETLDDMVGGGSAADDTVYGVSWNGSTDAATKNAIYDKIETLGSAGEANVQADWNEADVGSDAYILNKPTIPDVTGKANLSGATFTGDISAPNFSTAGIITVPALTGTTYSGTDIRAGLQAALTEIDSSADLTVSSYMEGVLDDADAATARTTLGAASDTLDTTNFNNNLSATDTTIQAAMDTIDNMVGGGSVDWTAPGAIGSVTPNSGAFTTLTADDINVGTPPSGETGEIGLPEDPDNGTNEVIIKAPADLAADRTIVADMIVEWVAAPSAATDICIAGQGAYDASYLYICQAANTWLRAAIATW